MQYHQTIELVAKYLRIVSTWSNCTVAIGWKPIDLHTLLQLLKPVESDWEELGYHLVKDHEVKSIKANSLQNNASEKALGEAIIKWSTRTVREKRKWRTLQTIAEKWGDHTLSTFLKENKLSGEWSINIYYSTAIMADHIV